MGGVFVGAFWADRPLPGLREVLDPALNGVLDRASPERNLPFKGGDLGLPGDPDLRPPPAPQIRI